MPNTLTHLLQELSSQDPFSVSKYFTDLTDTDLDILIRDCEKVPEEFQQAFLYAIRKRGVSDFQMNWVQNTFKPLDELTIYRLLDRIRSSECPFCKKESSLQAECTYQVVSYIINSKVKVNAYFGCKDCLKTERFAAYGLNMTLGWWSIKGLILNPLAYYFMIRRSNNEKRSEVYIKEWIIALKAILLCTDSQDELNKFLEIHNKSQQKNKFQRVYLNTLVKIFR